MLFRAAASKLLLLAVLATAVESHDISPVKAGTKNGPTARKAQETSKIATCDVYAEYSMHMTMSYINDLLESFDLAAIQEAVCGDINRQVTMPTIHNDPVAFYAMTLPEEYVQCAADTFMDAVAVIEDNEEGMDTSGVLDWSRESCESSIEVLVNEMSRRKLTSEDGRELFIFTLTAAIVAVATAGAVAASTVAVVMAAVPVVCTMEDCMGCDSVEGWYDSDGPTYDCDWYDMSDNCLVHGNAFSNFGFTAREACCSCGGGD
jgi:hypothetical protein